MSYLIQLLMALLGSLGFAALYNLHGRKLAFAALGGFIAWGTYLLVNILTESPYICAFVASIAMTIYSEIMARLDKVPVTVYLVTSAIPLIPGAGLYRSINALMLTNTDGFIAHGSYALMFAASMSAGITLTTLLFRFMLGAMHHHK